MIDFLHFYKENCGSCEHNHLRNDGRICDTFNENIDIFKITTLKFGCNSYMVNAMQDLKQRIEVGGKKYILYDEQVGQCNAEFSASIIRDRIPKCEPVISNVEGTQVWGVYVLEHMG